jgi:acetyl-CoA carboxylase biotin carboxyl carrier protein
MALNHEDIREILRIIDESPLEELRIESEGFSLHVRRGAGTQSMPFPTEPAVPPAPRARESARESEVVAASAPDQRDGRLTIAAPMLGTFYRAESPGQSPFIEVGSQVEPDTTVCIIEVMKMMNSVSAGVSGTIVEVCPENGELVEYGGPLFRVEPTG